MRLARLFDVQTGKHVFEQLTGRYWTSVSSERPPYTSLTMPHASFLLRAEVAAVHQRTDWSGGFTH
jgi:hypothetical protein